MKVLIINSYAGSLMIAAQQRGDEVIASLEDSGFGIAAQKHNFPQVNYVDAHPWPKLNLRGVVVIAHPPCAAASTQNYTNVARGAKVMGTKADSFKCHKDVMRYALGQGASALAVESVPGMLEMARKVQDDYARRYGYNVYRIMQNAITFGVPQWRPRFWAIFSKLPQFALTHVPTYKTIGDIHQRKGTVLDTTELKQILRHTGWSLEYLCDKYMNGEHVGSFWTVAGQVHPDLPRDLPNHGRLREKLKIGRIFNCKLPRMLSLEGYAPTVLSDALWFVPGRPLFLEEYMSVMGFPTNYQWPEKMRREFRKYLSKGVCPPVAKWVLEQIETNLQGQKAIASSFGLHSQMLEPGETADFQLPRKIVEEKLKARSK